MVTRAGHNNYCYCFRNTSSSGQKCDSHSRVGYEKCVADNGNKPGDQIGQASNPQDADKES